MISFKNWCYYPSRRLSFFQPWLPPFRQDRLNIEQDLSLRRLSRGKGNSRNREREREKERERRVHYFRSRWRATTSLIRPSILEATEPSISWRTPISGTPLPRTALTKLEERNENDDTHVCVCARLRPLPSFAPSSLLSSPLSALLIPARFSISSTIATSWPLPGGEIHEEDRWYEWCRGGRKGKGKGKGAR